MIKAVQVALRVDRWNPFAYVIAFRGVDLTGAVMHAQVRPEADQSGTPVLDLASTPDRTALGLCLLNVDTSGALPISYVRIQIPEASLGSAAPSAAELGDDLALGWDLVVALPGHTQARWLYGSFTIVAGYTQLSGATLANDPVPGAADAIVAVDAAALTLDLAGSDVLALLAVSFGASEATAKAAAKQAVQAVATAQATLADLSTPVDELLGSADYLDGTDLAGNTYINQQAASVAGDLTKVELFVRATGALEIKKFTASGSTYTETGSTTCNVAALGVVTLTPADFGEFPVAAGEYLGFFSEQVGGVHTSFVGAVPNHPWVTLPGDEGTGNPTPIGAALSINVGFTVTHRVVAATPTAFAGLKAEADTALETAISAQALVETLFNEVDVSFGLKGDPVAGDGSYGGSKIFGRAASAAGKLTKVSLWITDPGAVRLTKWTKAGSVLTKVASFDTAAKPSGRTVLTPDDFGDFPVAAGEYLGLETAYQCANISYVNNVAPDAPGWYLAETSTGHYETSYDGLTIRSAPQQPQLGFVITYHESANSVPGYAMTQAQAAEAAKVRRPLASSAVPRLLTNGGWNHGVGYGQSNSIGAGIGPVVSTAQPYANLTFGGGPASGKPGNSWNAVNTAPGTTTVMPLVEVELNPSADGTHCYESFVAGENNWMTGLAIEGLGLLPITHVCFGSTAGRGSTKIEDLSKGAAWYSHIRSHVTEAKARAVAAGVDYAVQTVSLVQGEHSAIAHTPTETWVGLARQLIADLNVDLRADAGGQAEPIHMLLVQTGSGTTAATLADLNRIQLAQVSAALRDPLIHFVAPMFIFYAPPDGLHLHGYGDLLMGRYFGRARYQLVHERREPDWMRPVSATVRGLTLAARWEVPHAPIVLDDALTGLATDFGLRVQDDTGQIALSSITVGADGTSVTMTLARAPGANPVFRCGLDYLGAGTIIDSGSSNNVRDSTPDTCDLGGVIRPMYHASPAFQLPIVALEGTGGTVTFTPGSTPVPSPTPAPAPAPTTTPTSVATMPTPTTDTLPALTTAGASYAGVWSNARLVSGFAGALVNASSGDLGASGAQVSTAELATARNGTDALRVIGGWYDQSGNNRPLLLKATAQAPAMREDVLIGATPAMCFDGVRGVDGGHRQVVAPLPLTMTDCTFVYVMDPTVSTQEQGYFDLVDGTANAAPVLRHLQWPGSLFNGALSDQHGNMMVAGTGTQSQQNTGRKISTVPQVVALRCTATGVEVWIDKAKIATVAPAAGTSAQLFFGALSNVAGLNSFNATFRAAAILALDKAVNDADLAAIQSALMGRFAIPDTYDATVVNIGSSRIAGMSNSTACRNKAWYERSRYNNRRVRTYNLAHDGKSIERCYADRVVFDAEVFGYAPTKPTVFVVDDAINSLGWIDGTQTTPSSINATYTSYVASLHGLGSTAKVVIPTTMPQSSGVYGSRSDAAVDADRVTLNNLVKANSAGADAISDPASDAAMGGFGTSTADRTKYPDELHPSSPGYSILSAYNPPATLGVLP